MTFAHCLTPEEFTTLLNLLPIISRRGGFSIKEYADITPLYEKMAATAKAHPDLFAFDEDQEEHDDREPDEKQDDEEEKDEEQQDEEQQDQEQQDQEQ